LHVSAADNIAPFRLLEECYSRGEIEEIIAVCLSEAQKNSSFKKIIAGSEN
jgi:hypothetical protein